MFTALNLYPLGFLAGILSTLSPCVLPLLPILAASALGAHRLGPLALAAGLALSYALIGLLLAATGSMIGMDPGLFRKLAALLLILFGWVMLSKRMQQYFIEITSGLGGAGQPLLDRISADTPGGQLVLGLVLGAIWSPCVGPTLGAAITLASQGENLAQSTIVMMMFGMGAGLPLALAGVFSQQALARYKTKIAMTGKNGKIILGVLLIIAGFLGFTGWDKAIEAWVLNHSPDWLIRLTISV